MNLVHEAGSDSLRDQDDVRWTRIDGPLPPSSSPAPTNSGPVTPTPDADCIQFDAPGTYSAPVGSLSLTVDMPGSGDTPWIGERDGFDIRQASCADFDAGVWIEAALATRVYTDGCAGRSVPVASTAEAIAAVSTAKDYSVLGQTDVALGGFSGVRLDLKSDEVPDALTRCPDGQIPLVDGAAGVDVNSIPPGNYLTLYVIDVDGTPLVLALQGYADWDPDPKAKVDAILASMQIGQSSQPTALAPTPTPTDTGTSPGPTPHPGEATFTSAINGFSMGVPAGWKTRAATQSWNGEPLDFDSPAADVIFDPTTADGPYLVVASKSFSRTSGDEWSQSVRQWTCTDGGHQFWGWHVDGVYSSQFGPCNSGSLIETATRGYLIRLVAPRAEKLGITDTWDTLKPMLETVDLRPEDAIDPPGTAEALPPCSDIAAGARYTNRFGTPKLSAKVPVGADDRWEGYRDGFELGDPCGSGGGIRITASIAESVPTDPCDPTAGEGANVSTAAEAAASMADAVGHRTSKPTELTIAGHDALRVEISTEGSTCTDPFTVLPGTEVGPGQDAIVYLVDIGGKHPLGIGVWYDRAGTAPARLAEAEAIVKSIQIES